MKCPVCKNSITGLIKTCPKCGFSDLNVEFINNDELMRWKENILEPYIKSWQSSYSASKLLIHEVQVERDQVLEQSLGISDIQYYIYSDTTQDQIFIVGELSFCNQRDRYIEFNCILYDYDDDIICTQKNKQCGEGIVTSSISPFAFDKYPISFRFYENYKKVKCIRIVPSETDDPWPAREALMHIEEHSQFDETIFNKETPSCSISIAEMSEKEKFPKNLFHFQPYLDKELTFDSLKVSIRKGEVFDGVACLDISGEYNGSSTKNYLLYILIYNLRGQLIGYSAKHTLGFDFCGMETFEDSIKVPNDEIVSKVIIRFDDNPLFLDKRRRR